MSPSWKNELLDWSNLQGYSFGITLSWNRPVTRVRAEADLKNFFRLVDQRLLKSHFNRKPAKARTEALIFFEGTEGVNLHVHSLWRAPSGKAFELMRLFPDKRGGLWNDVIASGSYDLKCLSPNGRNDEFIAYIMKEQNCSSDADRMLWASSFHGSQN